MFYVFTGWTRFDGKRCKDYSTSKKFDTLEEAQAAAQAVLDDPYLLVCDRLTDMSICDKSGRIVRRFDDLPTFEDYERARSGFTLD